MSPPAEPTFRFLIDLPVQNQWENVDLLRTSVLNCFSAIFRGMEGVHAFGTIAAELLENAIKYGDWTDDTKCLHLRIWGDEDTACVEVENPVDASSPDVGDLMRTMAWLKEFVSPEDAYRARLLAVAMSPRGVSKLGLARIAYEGNCSLTAQIDGKVLRVTSATPL
jgi:hypothetical protein